MKINNLISNIQQLSTSFRQSAISAVNVHLTVRNWLVGFYIVEFEQQGEDRAKYGEKLLQNLAEKLNEDGLSYRNLNLYRQFYVAYPQVANYLPVFFQRNTQIWHSLNAKLQLAENNDITILHSLSAESENPNAAIGHSLNAQLQFSENNGITTLHSASAESENTNTSIRQTPSAQLKSPENKDITIGQSAIAQFDSVNLPLIPAEKFVTKLSFSHISLLLPIENPLERLFYEVETIKNNWSVRELERAIFSKMIICKKSISHFVPQGQHFINRTLQCTDVEVTFCLKSRRDDTLMSCCKYRPLRDFRRTCVSASRKLKHTVNKATCLRHLNSSRFTDKHFSKFTRQKNAGKFYQERT